MFVSCPLLTNPNTRPNSHIGVRTEEKAFRLLLRFL